MKNHGWSRASACSRFSQKFSAPIRSTMPARRNLPATRSLAPVSITRTLRRCRSRIDFFQRLQAGDVDERHPAQPDDQHVADRCAVWRARARSFPPRRRRTAPPPRTPARRAASSGRDAQIRGCISCARRLPHLDAARHAAQEMQHREDHADVDRDHQVGEYREARTSPAGPRRRPAARAAPSSRSAAPRSCSRRRRTGSPPAPPTECAPPAAPGPAR